MLLELLPIFCCPTCKSNLRYVPPAGIAASDRGHVTTGALHCTDPACVKIYPIKQGIVDFLPHGPGFMWPGTAINHLSPTAWGYERFWRRKALSLLTGAPFPPERELDIVRHALFTDLDPASVTPPAGPSMAVYLDHACSTALYGRGIAQGLREHGNGTSGHVIALDYSKPMLKEATKYIAADGLSDMFTLVRARVERLPFRDGVFAGIADGGSLNEFPKPLRALQEVSRSLHPAGRSVFMVQMAATHTRARLLNKALTLSSGLLFFDLAALNRMYADAGLSITEQHVYRLLTITGMAKKAVSN